MDTGIHLRCVLLRLVHWLVVQELFKTLVQGRACVAVPVPTSKDILGGLLVAHSADLIVVLARGVAAPAVSMPSLLKRYILARTANSQHKLNQLWMPPPLKVGQNQAKLYKAVALILIYAPMYPPMYLFAAIYLVPSFFATRFGIAYWFAQPSRMDQTLTENMRGWLAGTIGIALVIKRLMTAEDIYSRALANVPLYLSVAAWAAYMVMYEVRYAATRAAQPDCRRPSP